MNLTFQTINTSPKPQDFTGRQSPNGGTSSALLHFPTSQRQSPEPSWHNPNPSVTSTNVKPPSHNGLRESLLNSTGKSIFKPFSSQIGSPQRVGADKKVISAAIPGGLAINAPENNRAENAFAREANRVTGFGAGMASAIIGN